MLKIGLVHSSILQWHIRWLPKRFFFNVYPKSGSFGRHMSENQFSILMQVKTSETSEKIEENITQLPKKPKRQRRFMKRKSWKKKQDKLKKVPINVSAIYNFSTLTLTLDMIKVLNRGLNFCVAPLKLNLTEILVDFRKFERKLRWREFWADEEGNIENSEWKPEIFPKNKTTFPTTRASTGLSNFIRPRVKM